MTLSAQLHFLSCRSSHLQDLQINKYKIKGMMLYIEPLVIIINNRGFLFSADIRHFNMQFSPARNYETSQHNLQCAVAQYCTGFGLQSHGIMRAPSRSAVIFNNEAALVRKKKKKMRKKNWGLFPIPTLIISCKELGSKYSSGEQEKEPAQLVNVFPSISTDVPEWNKLWRIIYWLKCTS